MCNTGVIEIHDFKTFAFISLPAKRNEPSLEDMCTSQF